VSLSPFETIGAQLPIGWSRRAGDYGHCGDSDAGGSLDPISIADILRFGFVTPPYTVARRLQLTSCEHVLRSAVAASRQAYESRHESSDLDSYVRVYHDLLCDVLKVVGERAKHPYLLQSAGKDSTSLAIAMADALPNVTCLTYCGASEEDEAESAGAIAEQLGLRHTVVRSDIHRAYDSYLHKVAGMPLITGDPAMLSYFDIIAGIGEDPCDTLVDGIGSDIYFGYIADGRKRLEEMLALELGSMARICEWRGVRRSKYLCYALSTFAMPRAHRILPTSRFTDAEVDALMGRKLSLASQTRFDDTIVGINAPPEAVRNLVLTLREIAAPIAKGSYAAMAHGLFVAYPYMDSRLIHWVRDSLPDRFRWDPRRRVNKVLVRRHIERRLGVLPYVRKKGSFHFDLATFAKHHVVHVMDMARAWGGDLLPGAERWLMDHRNDFGNKYFASKFYLLAILLPWIGSRR
jgi:asparagine synthetase B (glutamine-hydrolysing)